MNQTMLVKGIEVVGVLFAAFGGFLVGIAPPQAADARFAVGISSFFALIILLLVSSLAKKKYRGAWLIAAICFLVLAIASSYYYKSSFDELTFEYPGNPKVACVSGTEMTPLAQQAKRDNPGISNAQLLAGFGGPRFIFKVWPEPSVNAARRRLIFTYVILVMALASSIFSLTEGTLGSTNTESRRQNRPTRKRNKRRELRRKTQSLLASNQPLTTISQPGSKGGTSLMQLVQQNSRRAYCKA